MHACLTLKPFHREGQQERGAGRDMKKRKKKKEQEEERKGEREGKDNV